MELYYKSTLEDCGHPEQQTDLIKQYTEEWWNQYDDELNGLTENNSVKIKTRIPENPF